MSFQASSGSFREVEDSCGISFRIPRDTFLFVTWMLMRIFESDGPARLWAREPQLVAGRV